MTRHKHKLCLTNLQYDPESKQFRYVVKVKCDDKGPMRLEQGGTNGETYFCPHCWDYESYHKGNLQYELNKFTKRANKILAKLSKLT